MGFPPRFLLFDPWFAEHQPHLRSLCRLTTGIKIGTSRRTRKVRKSPGRGPSSFCRIFSRWSSEKNSKNLKNYLCNWHVLSMQLTFAHLKKRPGFPQKMLRFPIPCQSCQYTVVGPVGFLGSRRWIALRMVSETCVHGPALNGIKNTHSGQFLTNLTPSCT